MITRGGTGAQKKVREAGDADPLYLHVVKTLGKDTSTHSLNHRATYVTVHKQSHSNILITHTTFALLFCSV